MPPPSLNARQTATWISGQQSLSLRKRGTLWQERRGLFLGEFLQVDNFPFVFPGGPEANGDEAPCTSVGCIFKHALAAGGLSGRLAVAMVREALLFRLNDKIDAAVKSMRGRSRKFEAESGFFGIDGGSQEEA